MKLGIRELRKQISKIISDMAENDVHFITKQNKLKAAIIPVEKLLSLARKSEDSVLLEKIQLAEKDDLKGFLESREFFKNVLTEFLKKSRAYKMSDGTTEKLEVLLNLVDEVISERGMEDDTALLSHAVSKMEALIRPVIYQEYFVVNKTFYSLVKEGAEEMIKQSNESDTVEYKRYLEFLIGFMRNSEIRTESEVKSASWYSEKFLVEFLIGEKKVFRIFSLLPFDPQHYLYDDRFLWLGTPLGQKLDSTKVGKSFRSGNKTYNLLAKI